ncbi:MAG: nucleotidyltransferase family protein [Chloroflexia bacterium]
MSLLAGNLGEVQRLLDEAGLPWGVCAGAAAHLYGVRRPIENVDILLPPGRLHQARNLLSHKGHAAQYDGRILLWRGIKLFDDLSVTMAGRRYPFLMDAPMEGRLRRQMLLGSRVSVLAPEDVLVHKALLAQADRSPGKHHREDLLAIVRVQKEALDLAYLLRRLELCQARKPLQALLEEIGLALPD